MKKLLPNRYPAQKIYLPKKWRVSCQITSRLINRYTIDRYENDDFPKNDDYAKK